VLTDTPRIERTIDGAFAATFDSEPEPAPTMDRELQTRIMQRALMDYAINWMGGRVNPSDADSSKDNVKARAFLTSRWSEAAIVDSVAVGPKSFFVKMHGRYAPVMCFIVQRSNGPSCFDTDR
jgi:hypothetical protein